MGEHDQRSVRGRYPWSTSGLSAYAHQGGEGVRHRPVHRVLEHDPGELRGVVRGEDLTCARAAPSLSTAISRATHRDSVFTPGVMQDQPRRIWPMLAPHEWPTTAGRASPSSAYRRGGVLLLITRLSCQDCDGGVKVLCQSLHDRMVGRSHSNALVWLHRQQRDVLRVPRQLQPCMREGVGSW